MVQVRCRKCRCILSEKEEDIEEHNPASSHPPRDFQLKEYRQGRWGRLRENEKCAHLFMHELPWMEPFIRDVSENVIPCPKCSAKLGNFSWIGVRCSCGGWVVPAFALLKCKIDLIGTA